MSRENVPGTYAVMDFSPQYEFRSIKRGDLVAFSKLTLLALPKAIDELCFRKKTQTKMSAHYPFY